tara:strand:+ start:13705 stop:14736 length:1032 start_codon:yes stop_codon:yes gene_type:complete
MLIKKKKIPVKEIILIGFLPSFLKKMIYRSKGYKIGKNVSFGIGSVIIGKNVSIGDNTSIGLISVVRADYIDIGRHVVIGTLTMIDTVKVIIGDDSRINEKVIVGGIKTPESMLKLGKRVIIMEYSFINPTKPIIIGDDSGIGGHCLLFTHGSWLSQMDGFPVTFAPITLGERVWLPWRVFIMPGVEIGNEVVIGANSLVSKNLPSNVLAAGSPAKILVENYPKPISEEDRSAIFSNILNDFIAYLSFNNYDVVMSEVNTSILIKIEGKKTTNEIFISKNNELHTFSNTDNLLIIDKATDVAERDKNIMILNLKTKKRIGTNKIGEEFTKFLSRYGVRFDRLD